MTAIRVLGISGSLRAASNNTKLLRAAIELVGEGVRLDLWQDLGLVPPFSEDDEGVGASPSPSGAAGAQAELRKALGRAGARVLDGELSLGHAHEAFGPDGQLRDPELARGLSDLLGNLQRALNPVREAV